MSFPSAKTGQGNYWNGSVLESHLLWDLELKMHSWNQMEMMILFYQKEEDKRWSWQSLRCSTLEFKPPHPLNRHENHTSLHPEYTLIPKPLGALRGKFKNTQVGKETFCTEYMNNYYQGGRKCMTWQQMHLPDWGEIWPAIQLQSNTHSPRE